jgi:hypothetical protein
MRVMRETTDAENVLTREMDAVITHLHERITELKDSRKTKLTKGELDLFDEIEHDLRGAQARIRKEIEDIENIVE